MDALEPPSPTPDTPMPLDDSSRTTSESLGTGEPGKGGALRTTKRTQARARLTFGVDAHPDATRFVVESRSMLPTLPTLSTWTLFRPHIQRRAGSSFSVDPPTGRVRVQKRGVRQRLVPGKLGGCGHRQGGGVRGSGPDARTHPAQGHRCVLPLGQHPSVSFQSRAYLRVSRARRRAYRGISDAPPADATVRRGLTGTSRPPPTTHHPAV